MVEVYETEILVSKAEKKKISAFTELNLLHEEKP